MEYSQRYSKERETQGHAHFLHDMQSPQGPTWQVQRPRMPPWHPSGQDGATVERTPHPAGSEARDGPPLAKRPLSLSLPGCCCCCEGFHNPVASSSSIAEVASRGFHCLLLDSAPTAVAAASRAHSYSAVCRAISRTRVSGLIGIAIVELQAVWRPWRTL